jgi:hypothetical protein
MRRKRGVRAGTPDNLVLDCGLFVAIELKSSAGTLGPAQREARLKILASGGLWWLCKSANSAMWALAESGVKFRENEREGGAVERWEQPELEAWEIPRRSPRERRAMHPALLARDRAYRERRRAREFPAQTATERDDAAGPARGAGSWPTSEAASALMKSAASLIGFESIKISFGLVFV